MVDYICFILLLISIYVIAGVSLNLLIGFAGLFSLAHASFMGIGAYVTTMLMLNLGWNFFLTIPCAFIMGGIVSAAFGATILKVKGDEYIIGALAFQSIIFGFFMNATEITRGSNGFFNIPKPAIFGNILSSQWSILIVAIIITAICVFICLRLANSAFGQVLQAIREDETAAQSLGKNIALYKIAAFSIGGGIVAIAGSIYATAVGFIDPFAFDLNQSIFMLSIVIIGGAGNLWGSVVGAIFLFLLPEGLKLFQMSEAVAGPVRSMIYGILLLAFMAFRPQGIIPERIHGFIGRMRAGQ
jgi:branched-chain amino acid transport system permease protein